MLVLSRDINEEIVLPSLGVSIVIVGVGQNPQHPTQVKVGIRAPKEAPVFRLELWRRIQAEAAAGRSGGQD